MMKLFTVSVATIALLLAGATSHAQDGAGLECQFDPAKGLVSATYGGDTIVKDGGIVVKGVRLQQRTSGAEGDEFGNIKYTETHIKEPVGERTFDANSKTVTTRYEWGEIAARYTPVKDRLTVDVSIHNTTKQYISGFWLDLMQFELPAKREVDVKIGAQQRAVDQRIVQASSFGNGHLMVMAYETLKTPLELWIKKPSGDEKGFPLFMAGGLPVPEPGEYNVHDGGSPAVAPGQTLSIRFSLRFASAQTSVTDLIADINQSMHELHGNGAKWTDRRPIAMLTVSSVGHRTPTNPRGWFHDKTVDITTEAGKAKFHAQAMKYADNSIKVIKDTGGQGMIFWDVEGSENDHAITYIGDPRMVKELAPEMDAIADEFFKKFTDAGLRTGVTLRPSRVYLDEKTKKLAHNPGNAWPAPTDYNDQKPKEVPRHLFYPIAQRIVDKITYAKERWGCTLIYIDTNFIGQWYTENGERKMVQLAMTAEMYRHITKAHPDVLIIPEHVRGALGEQEAGYAYVAPYFELDLKAYGTPDRIRRLFPGAFSVVNIADGPFDENREALLKSVAQGDILMFRGWFNDPHNAKTKSVYEEAARMRPTTAPR